VIGHSSLSISIETPTIVLFIPVGDGKPTMSQSWAGCVTLPVFILKMNIREDSTGKKIGEECADQVERDVAQKSNAHAASVD
jgi:hypothetical protein